jgi:hypothetical protein
LPAWCRLRAVSKLFSRSWFRKKPAAPEVSQLLLDADFETVYFVENILLNLWEAAPTPMVWEASPTPIERPELEQLIGNGATSRKCFQLSKRH